MDYKKIFKNQEFRLKLINCLRFIPTKPYLKMVYKIKTGRKLNLKNPVGFNEKLNWLKLNDIHPEYTNLADKVLVRKHVEEKIGEGYSIPLLGVYKKFDEIDFDELPEQFVLKCNHDSGSVKVIKAKSELSEKQIRELKKFFKGRLKINPFNIGREYPYKDIEPKIIVEKYMIPDSASEIDDYKFLCFNGQPKLMYICSGRNSIRREDYFDMDFNRISMRSSQIESDIAPSKPKNFELMKELAGKLSQGLRHVRVDFFEVNGKVYFSEFTFFNNGGFWLYHPDEWERKLGDWIELQSSKKE